MVFVAQKWVFLEREIISQGGSGSQTNLEELQGSTDSEPIISTSSHPHVEKLVEPNDISLPLRRSSRVSQLSGFYSFHITVEGETLITDRTLVNLEEPADYNEEMVDLEAAK